MSSPLTPRLIFLLRWTDRSLRLDPKRLRNELEGLYGEKKRSSTERVSPTRETTLNGTREEWRLRDSDAGFFCGVIGILQRTVTSKRGREIESVLSYFFCLRWHTWGPQISKLNLLIPIWLYNVLDPITSSPFDCGFWSRVLWVSHHVQGVNTRRRSY